MIALGCIVGVSLSFLLAFAMLCAGSRRDDADEQIMRGLECGDWPALPKDFPRVHAASYGEKGQHDHVA